MPQRNEIARARSWGDYSSCGSSNWTKERVAVLKQKQFETRLLGKVAAMD